jgi:hypothetical protein
MNAQHLLEHVIDPALRRVRLYSPAAALLLLGTAITESELTWLRQHNGGPARGLWQMEPATHDDIWRNYLRYRVDLHDRVIDCMTEAEDGHQQLVSNLTYAAVMARLVYWRHEDPLPAADDVDAQARYWKRHYNTTRGAGRPEDYRDKAGPHIRELAPTIAT